MSISLSSASGSEAPDLPPETRIACRLRDRLRSEGIDPAERPDEVERVAVAEVQRHNDFALARGLEAVDDESAAVRRVLASVAGYGPLQALLDDPSVEELWINAPDRIFVARGGRSERVALALTEEQVRDLVERMLHASGRRVDLSQPFADASLPDGSRLHVVVRQPKSRGRSIRHDGSCCGRVRLTCRLQRGARR
ncbi:ATPase, T2SS/T4P/T4SS family [Microbacterium arborescens]|uniref:ATPase, T2SS/T4P/T4SS family n=1 Tax=Microbacterium arborescens TaxID=33883 RepID=UPI001F072D17|nr:ATPase, T2SS/T4P/T4SS family [Microbacterium arborescens]